MNRESKTRKQINSIQGLALWGLFLAIFAARPSSAPARPPVAVAEPRRVRGRAAARESRGGRDIKPGQTGVNREGTDDKSAQSSPTSDWMPGRLPHSRTTELTLPSRFQAGKGMAMPGAGAGLEGLFRGRTAI